MTTQQACERVVELQEIRNGRVYRTFYCIHDGELDYWMSTEPFGGAIWTRSLACRQEFPSRQAAQDRLQEFLAWRQRQEQSRAAETARRTAASGEERAGDPIPGSRYVRAFCRTCGEPMRVSPEAFKSGIYADCSKCEAEFHPGYGKAAGYDGNWDNAVRAMEDAA